MRFNSWGRMLSVCFQRNTLISRYEISWRFLNTCKISGCFSKKILRSWCCPECWYHVAVKTTGNKTNRVWKKKISVKDLETVKPSHNELLSSVSRQCLICKVTLEVSLFDLWSLTEARWLKQLLQFAFIRIATTII